MIVPFMFVDASWLSLPTSSLTAHLIKVTYGIVLNEPHHDMVERVLDISEDILTPGRYVVEAIPSLRNIPEWAPGAHFKRFASKARQDVTVIVDSLFNAAKSTVSLICTIQNSILKQSQPEDQSVVGRLLENPQSLGVVNPSELERVVKSMAITTYLGELSHAQEISQGSLNQISDITGGIDTVSSIIYISPIAFLSLP